MPAGRVLVPAEVTSIWMYPCIDEHCGQVTGERDIAFMEGGNLEAGEVHVLSGNDIDDSNVRLTLADVR